MRSLLLSLMAAGVLQAAAGSYEYAYSPLDASVGTERSALEGRSFERIVRFEAINAVEGSLAGESKEKIDQIAEVCKGYDPKRHELLVTVIGHTRPTTDDAGEAAIDSRVYGEVMRSWFADTLGHEESERQGKDAAEAVFEKLRDAGVDEGLMQVESRSDKDPAYTDATRDGVEGSERVMVTLYVMKPKAVDSDGDGVMDHADACPGTPAGVAVDAKGCPLDSDKDGVPDSLDKCPNTPSGVAVDTQGCPLDSDRDGVLDYKDQCPDTPESFKVDAQGCPLSRKLMLTFETNSYRIDDISYPQVREFALFMKQNPLYKAEIVGHTDSIGKAAANMTLSINRAKAVEEALVNEGVAAERLSSSGRGELEPVESNRSEAGRQANRRIEVKLIR